MPTRMAAILTMAAAFICAGTEAAEMELDYSAFQAHGSPLMFGGVTADPSAPWDAYMAMGLTAIRQHIRSGSADFIKGKGLHYIAITNYNNNSHKVPTNWADYENWMKGSFLLVKGKVDGVEVWNEPGPGFLDLSGTSYDNLDWVWQRLDEIYGTNDRSRLPKFAQAETYAIDNWSGNTPAQERDIEIKRVCAYLDIYYHTVRAIRSLDTTVAIGGPAAAGAHIRYLIHGFLGGILTDPRLERKDVAFATFHTYYYIHEGMNPIYFWREILREYGRPDLPVYMTEWNQDGGQWGTAQGMEEAGIPFNGQRLSNFFNTGMAGAHHYQMGQAHQNWKFFEGSTIAPKARTWRLMSRELGLGMGPSTVVKFADSSALAREVRDSLINCCQDIATNKFAEPEEWTSVMGAVNYQHKPVAVLSNWGNVSRAVNVELKGLTGLSGQVPVKVFLASIGNDATQPAQTLSVNVTNGTITFTGTQPRLSVMGLLVDAAVQPPMPVSVDRPHTPCISRAPLDRIRIVGAGGSISLRNAAGPARVGFFSPQGRCEGIWHIGTGNSVLRASSGHGIGIVTVENGPHVTAARIIR